MPWPGYIVLEQNQHFSKRMLVPYVSSLAAPLGVPHFDRVTPDCRYGRAASSVAEAGHDLGRSRVR